jgi:hypothetical protein
MASTRNKNSTGDYKLEQRQNTGILAYSEYTYSSKPVETHFPGNGLLTGRMAPMNLSSNACDIETQLFGIGSTNLVSPKEYINPDIKPLQSLNVIDRLPILIPTPLVVEHNQRPYPMN